MEDELTLNEKELMDDTGIDAEEVHRAGEFEELRSLVEETRETLLAAIAGIKTDIDSYASNRIATAVENGAVITDDGETAVITFDDYDDEDDEFDLSI